MFDHRSVWDTWGNQKDTILGLKREEEGRAEAQAARLAPFARFQEGSCRRSRPGTLQELRLILTFKI